MKAQRLFDLLLLGMFLTAGCAEGRLYPVQGPYSALSPVPVFTARASGVFNSGNVSVTLQNGEKGSGRWVVAQAAPASTANSPAGTQAESMASIWDAIYGQGFYVSHVLGSKLFARAEIHGNAGTILQIEMYRSPGEPDAPINIRGVARDNKNNIYKVVF
jgi:hypothetical protein